MVLVFVTRFSSTTFHTAILARTMNIPALVSTKIDSLEGTKSTIVDGNACILILNLDSETLKDYESKANNEQERKALLGKLKRQPSATKDGRKINLYANIGDIDDLAAVLRIIQMVIDRAHKNGIWAVICGELAADTTLTKTFVKMGIDELSMVLPVRDKILHTSYK